MMGGWPPKQVGDGRLKTLPRPLISGRLMVGGSALQGPGFRSKPGPASSPPTGW